jgi:hypothetical protein
MVQRATFEVDADDKDLTTHVDECKLLFPYFHHVLYHPVGLESRVIVAIVLSFR